MRPHAPEPGDRSQLSLSRLCCLRDCQCSEWYRPLQTDFYIRAAHRSEVADSGCAVTRLREHTDMDGHIYTRPVALATSFCCVMFARDILAQASSSRVALKQLAEF